MTEVLSGSPGGTGRAEPYPDRLEVVHDDVDALRLVDLPEVSVAAVEVSATGSAGSIGPDAPTRLDAPTRRRSIAGSLLARLLVSDALAVTVALAAAYVGRFGVDRIEPSGLDYGLVALGIGAAWMAALALQRCYEPRVLGIGGEEFKRVTAATFVVFGATAIVSYLMRADVARGFVGLAFPLGLVLLVGGRFLARQWLKRARVNGRLCHRVVVVGDHPSLSRFVTELARDPGAGFQIVGACLPVGATSGAPHGVPVAGSYDDLPAVVRRLGADVVAVTASDSITPDRLRRMAWSLEGGSVDVVVAPAVTDVAGPRVTVRPVAGLPLLYLDEPRLSGVARVVKGTLDRLGSLLALVALAPLLCVVGVLVRLDSRGPALFRQSRVGRDGRTFRVVKFRTMYADAEARWDALRAENEGDGLLFKIRDDPRVTRVGRWLRRTSLDELPQLVNVLLGSMSLVGPRPLAVAADEFGGDEHRRHLVKPGMTGLWQVSGREEQSWDDAVRLDLFYVENWSLSLDLMILLRTVLAVFRGR